MNTLRDRVIVTAVATLGIAGLVIGLSPRAQSTTAAPVPVVIQNTSVPVTDTLAGQQPFSKRLDIGFQINGGGPGVGVGTFTVPAGKRLVITYVSADASVAPGASLLFDLGTTNNGSQVEAHIPFVAQGSLFSRDTYALSQQTTIYADPSSSVTVSVLNSNPTALSGMIVGIYGYLVNA